MVIEKAKAEGQEQDSYGAVTIRYSIDIVFTFMLCVLCASWTSCWAFACLPSLPRPRDVDLCCISFERAKCRQQLSRSQRVCAYSKRGREEEASTDGIRIATVHHESSSDRSIALLVERWLEQQHHRNCYLKGHLQIPWLSEVTRGSKKSPLDHSHCDRPLALV